MTHLSTINIPGHRVIHWMDVLRKTEDDNERYTLLECFWGSQIRSKYWMTQELKKISENISGHVYVLGGWHGLSAMVLVDNFYKIEHVFSVDKNPTCEKHGRLLSNADKKITFLTSDMTLLKNYYKTQLIVNTSTEHITQDEFDDWMSNIPDNTLVVLQGNNFIQLGEQHIRTCESLEDFKNKNKLGRVLYEGELDCTQFTRYMIIGYKNEL